MVLGNDPFLRGAAPRPPAASEPAVVTAPEPSPAAPPASTVAPEPAPVPVAAAPAPVAATSAPAPAPVSSPVIAGPAPRIAPAAASSLRARLAELESRVESAATAAAERLADLGRHEATGGAARDLLQALVGLVPAIRERLAGLSALRTFFAGTGELDFFGMDRELTERAAPLLEFLYTAWWRVEPRQIENVPAQGPVVIVANHGGLLPWDALVLRLALQRHHPQHRDLRPLLDEHALKIPVAGGVATRLGAVPATPDHALRLLGEGRAIGVFPEGSRASDRPWPERYRVQRFGRGGFARIALRAGATVVPCAIVGSEETSAPFARAGWLSEVLDLPFLAATRPVLPLFALGFIPLPSRWSLRFGRPIDPRAATAEDEAGKVLQTTERVRAALQEMLDEDVAARRSVYL